MLDKTLLKNYLLKPACLSIVILVSLFLISKVSALNFSLSSNDLRNSFEVTGIGKISAVPNIAAINFTVKEKGATQEEAKNAVNSKQNQAISILTSLGIKKKDIKTTSFTVSENYENVPVIEPQTYQANQMYPIKNPSLVQKGYIADSITEVKAEKVETLNQAIDKITALGIYASGVQYTFADPDVYNKQAVEKAIVDAKKKAQDLARSAGFKLGKIASIRVNDGNPYPQPVYAMQAGENSSADHKTNLQPGSSDITATVSISYYIKN